MLECTYWVCSSVVEQLPFKQLAAGSNPAGPTLGPFVYRLGHLVFIQARAVRFRQGSPRRTFSQKQRLSPMRRQTHGAMRRAI